MYWGFLIYTVWKDYIENLGDAEQKLAAWRTVGTMRWGAYLFGHSERPEDPRFYVIVWGKSISAYFKQYFRNMPGRLGGQCANQKGFRKAQPCLQGGPGAQRSYWHAASCGLPSTCHCAALMLSTRTAYRHLSRLWSCIFTKALGNSTDDGIRLKGAGSPLGLHQNLKAFWKSIWRYLVEVNTKYYTREGEINIKQRTTNQTTTKGIS